MALIAPLTKAMGDANGMPLVNLKINSIVNSLPEYTKEVDIKLAEGHSVVYVKVHSPNQIELIGKFELRHFSVERSAARWAFRADDGKYTEGSYSAVTLLSRLSVKLRIPIILLHSDTGLRTTFKFRIDPNYRIMSVPRYRDLIKTAG